VTGTPCPTCGALGSDATGSCRSCAAFTDTFVVAEPPEASTDPRLPDAGGAAGPSIFGPGQSFGERYTIVERIGDGGMGEVYKAIDRRRQGRTVALKLIRASLAQSGDALLRFRRELDLAQKVSHANVCRLHDLGEVDGQLYISMEYVDGQTLDDLIRTMGRLSSLQTASLGRQICAGLQAVHEQGIVHRDLKPSNVMVDRAGHAIVMDFGMAYHPEAEKLTRAGMVVGTLAYVAPEQARGTGTDTRSDVYALGLLLYEMLTGRRPPGDGAPLPLALRDAGERCPPPSHFAPEVHEVLDVVVMRCLYRDPASRFASVAEVGEALARASDALATTMSPVIAPAARTSLDTVSTLQRPRSDRLRRLSALLGAVLVGALLYRLGSCPAGAPVSIAFCPLTYAGPKEHSSLAKLVPLFLGDQLRARKGCTVAPFASARTFEPTGDAGLVATELDVGFVVQGQIDVLGPQVRTVLHLQKAGGTRSSREFRGQTEDALVTAQAMAEWIASEVGIGRPAAGPTSAARLAALDLYLRGLTYLEGWDVERNSELAESAFSKALQIDDGFEEARAGLALAKWRRFRDTQDATAARQALEVAERAAQGGPSLPECQLALGVVLLGHGRSVEAAASLEKAQELAPADDAIARRIGVAYAAAKRDPEARRAFERAISLRPAYWENYNAFGAYCLRQGDNARSKALFQKVVELRPNADVGYTNLALAHLQEGELAAAEPLLTKAIQLNPAPEVRANLGVVYYGTGRFEEAARQFRLAIDGGSERAEIWGNLGDAERQLGRAEPARFAYDHAIEAAQAGLRVNPADMELRGSLAMALAGANRCGEARKQSALILEAKPPSALATYYWSIASAICGDVPASTEALATALRAGVVADAETNPDLRLARSRPGIREILDSRRRAREAARLTPG
jgi:eukaryotic-like serine/threonine-protein kinase